MASSSSSSSDDEAAPAAKPDWLTQEDDSARCLVFLVTFAAVLSETAQQAETPLKELTDLSRSDIMDAMLDALAHPVVEAANQRGGRPRSKGIEAVKLVVFMEEPKHFHVALRLSAVSRFMPFKTALRQRSGLASHWSTSHSQWWSAVRYGIFTTEHKPEVDQRPLVFLKSVGVLEPVAGHGQALEFTAPRMNSVVVNLYEEAQEPFNANLWTKRRQKAETSAAGAASAAGKQAKTAKFNLMDFTALVLDKGLATPNAVLAYVQQHGSHGCQLFCLRNQKRLAELITGAEQWQRAKQQHDLELETDWSLIQRLSGGRCTCEGECRWTSAASDFFRRNQATVDPELLAASLANVICFGPSKTARVPMLAGVTNAGKSMILDPVVAVFGRQAVDFCPALGASMALSSLATNKAIRFIYWDEYSPVDFAARPSRSPTVPAVTFKKLFAGQYLRLQVSQAHHDGNPDFKWSRGAAMTAPLEGLWDAVLPVSNEDVRHMQSRIIQFEARVPIQGPLQPVPHCASSWCKYVVQSAAAYAARRPQQVVLPEASIDDEDL